MQVKLFNKKKILGRNTLMHAWFSASEAASIGPAVAFRNSTMVPFSIATNYSATASEDVASVTNTIVGDLKTKLISAARSGSEE